MKKITDFVYSKQSTRKLKMSCFNNELSEFLINISSNEQYLLIELWKNWTMVMGEDLSNIVIPLGRRETVLIVGGEDTMALQELVFMKAEILERVNIFMDTNFFDRVEVRLCVKNQSLNKKFEIVKIKYKHHIKRPQSNMLGKSFIQDQDKHTPVGSCYKAYLAMCNGISEEC